MTREEALDLISDVEKFYCESADEYGYYCYEVESVIDKIYDEHEAQLKAKDEEIDRLKAIVEEAIRKPMGVEPHSWSDYKIKDNA